MGAAEEFFRKEGFWPCQAYWEGDYYDIQEAKKLASLNKQDAEKAKGEKK